MLGLEYPSTLRTLNNLAGVLRKQGKYEQAEEMYRQTFELQKRVLGLQHPKTLASMNDLAIMLSEQGKDEQAVQMHQQVLAGREGYLRSDHDTTSSTFKSPSNPYHDQDKLAETYSRAQVETVPTPGPGHASNPTTIKDPSKMYTVQSRLDKLEQTEIQAQVTRDLTDINNGSSQPQAIAATFVSWHDSGIGSSIPTAADVKSSTQADEVSSMINTESLNPDVKLRVGRIDASDDDIGSLITRDHKDEIVAAENHLMRCLGKKAEPTGLIAQLKAEMTENALKEDLTKHLKFYFLDLRFCSSTKLEKESAGLLRSRRYRERVASGLLRRLQGDDDLDGQDTDMTQPLSSFEEKLFVLERWLRDDPNFHSPDDPESDPSAPTQETTIELGNDEALGQQHMDMLSSFEGESQSLCLSSDADDGEFSQPEFDYVKKMERFMFEGLPFRKFLERLQLQTIRLPYISIRQTLMAVRENDIEFCFPNSGSWFDRLRSYVERNSAAKWDWWPLSPPRSALADDHCRIMWRCVSLNRNCCSLTNALRIVVQNTMRILPLKMLADCNL